MSSQKCNNLVRQVLKEIIAEPPSSTRKSCDIEQLKLAEAVTYLQKKIERQQTQVKVLSDQLGREIEAKEHIIMLLNEEKEKNCKLTQHLNNSNRNAAESKKKLAKFELFQNRETKIKQEYEVKLAKSKQFLRKKQELLAKANAKIEQLQKNFPNMSSIQSELKQLREKMVFMKKREDQLAKENEGCKMEIRQLRQQLQVKDETILFSEEHLRRLREEYEQLEEGHDQEQRQSRQLQVEMKELLQQQNEQIKQLNERLKFKQEIEECIKSEKPLQKSQICSFVPEKPQWELTIFKNEIKRTFDSHLPEGQVRQGLQSDIMLIFQAVETSFNSILSQVLNGIE